VPDPPLVFKVDENLPEDIAATLREAGHQASTVASQGLAGAEDARLAEVLRRERRILVTLDVDFADIRTSPLRATETLARRLRVVEEDAVRIHGEA